MTTNVLENLTVDSKGCSAAVVEEQKTVATATDTKKFESSSALRSWLNLETTPRLYKIKHIDWMKNQVKVECIPLVLDPQRKAAEDAKEKLYAKYDGSEVSYEKYWKRAGGERK